MTSWADMSRVEFDPALLSAKGRRFVAAAPDTLFPRLMPEPDRKPAPRPAPEQLPGQDALFPEGE